MRTAFHSTSYINTHQFPKHFLKPSRFMLPSVLLHFRRRICTFLVTVFEGQCKTHPLGIATHQPQGKTTLQRYNITKLYLISPGKHTYWPTDPNKRPDLIDFPATRRMPRAHVHVEHLTDLS